MTMHGLDYLMADSAGRGIETKEEVEDRAALLELDAS
jgi:hypothetical protein